MYTFIFKYGMRLVIIIVHMFISIAKYLASIIAYTHCDHFATLKGLLRDSSNQRRSSNPS